MISGPLTVDWETYRAHIERRYALLISLLILSIGPLSSLFDSILLVKADPRYFTWLSVANALGSLFTLFALHRWKQNYKPYRISVWLNLNLLSITFLYGLSFAFREAPDLFWLYTLGYSMLFWLLNMILPFPLRAAFSLYTISLLSYVGVVISNWHLADKARTLGASFYIIVMIILTMSSNIIRWRLHRKVFDSTQELIKAMQRASDERAAALDIRIKQAQLEALHARLDPHFLFNSLSSLAELAHSAPSKAEKGLLDLAELFRDTLHHTNVATIHLSEELRLIESYTAIESLRLGERLRVKFDIAHDATSKLVPPRALQVLVENAIVHGISRLTTGGVVIIGARVEGTQLRLWVHNDGPPYEQKNSGGSRTALRDLQARLTLLYGPAANIHAAHHSNGRYEVQITFSIP